MSADEWHRQVANPLKAELVRAGLGYKGLINRLKAIVMDESCKGIAAKINRGTFSFAFFMQCIKAMGITEVRL